MCYIYNWTSVCKEWQASFHMPCLELICLGKIYRIGAFAFLRTYLLFFPRKLKTYSLWNMQLTETYCTWICTLMIYVSTYHFLISSGGSPRGLYVDSYRELLLNAYVCLHWRLNVGKYGIILFLSHVLWTNRLLNMFCIYEHNNLWLSQ